MARTIILLNHKSGEVIKVYLNAQDETCIKSRYEGNVESWLLTRFDMDFNEIDWMVVDKLNERTIDRTKIECGTVNEIIIDTYLPYNSGWGLNNGEHALLMKFFDGIAVEVDDDWLEVKAEEDPVIMFYPTVNEVRNSDYMQATIRSYTGREWGQDENVYDIALTYGKIRRRKHYEQI